MSTCSILSALLVVWIHAYNIEVYNSPNRVLYWVQEVISQGVARGAVPFFLMSSAFFLYSKDKKVADVYRSRTKSLVVPYLLWNLVYMVAFAVLRHLSLVSAGMETVTIGNVAQGLFLYKYNYSYWFMRDLILLTALYPLLRWVIRRSKMVALVGGIVLLAAIFWSAPRMYDLFCFLKSAFFYYFGAFIGYHYEEQAEKAVTLPSKKLWIAVAVLLIISGILFCAWYVYWTAILALFRDFSTALLLFFFVAVCRIRIGGVFAGLSFMIYSIHPLLLEIIEKGFYLLFPHNDLWMMVDYVLAPVLCLVVIIGICWAWKKLLPGVYKVFNGGRV